MKIGILSDLHGNVDALQEVLRAAEVEKIDQLLILGDIVGYYYDPAAILELLKDWKYLFVRGNHEDILASVIEGKSDDEALKRKYGSAHFMAAIDLSTSQINFLIHSPEQLAVELNGLNILMCHGSPWDHNAYLYPDTPEDILKGCDADGIDFIFVGHSHYQFIKKFPNTTLVNVGSVGQSREKGGMAQWAILDTDIAEVSLISTPYDIGPLIEKIDLIDPNITYLKTILNRN